MANKLIQLTDGSDNLYPFFGSFVRAWSPNKWKSEGGNFTIGTYGIIVSIADHAGTTFLPSMTGTSIAHSDTYFLYISYNKELYIGFSINNANDVTWTKI